MSANVLDGRIVAAEITERSIERVGELARDGRRRCLLIVSATTAPSSDSYVQALTRYGTRIGVQVNVEQLGEEASVETIRRTLASASKDPSVHGVILQTPLPHGVSLLEVATAIAVEKDVDGANPLSLGTWMSGGTGFAPATASAVIELLDHHGVELAGSRVTVVGRSPVVGKPLLHLFLNRDATVTVAHSRTTDLECATRGASILVVAAGRAGLITGEHVGEGAVVVDVGTNFDEAGRLFGDVDVQSVAAKAAALSPVPGGVGSVTTALLFRNTIAGPGAREPRMASAEAATTEPDPVPAHR